MVTNNGGEGEGAGVLFANASAGTASYDNLVQGNYIAGNGLSGVTMHAHTLDAGPVRGPERQRDHRQHHRQEQPRRRHAGLPAGSPDGPEDHRRPRVLRRHAGPLTIAHNHIFNNSIGIWLSKPVTAFGLSTNSFHHVKTPISAGH